MEDPRVELSILAVALAHEAQLVCVAFPASEPLAELVALLKPE